jgi:hypothetical protein
VALLKKMIDKALGGTPQTNGMSMDIEWRDDCGYNKFFEHEMIWDQGFYDGNDEDWRQIGIPHNLLSDINTNAKGKYGWHFDVVRDTKSAIITFEDEDDALWFRLTHNKE